MADAATEFLLQNLQQLLIYHTHMISDAKNQVEELENNLRLFKAFLNDTAKIRREDDDLREIFRLIRDVVYEAEDVVDAFVAHAAEARSGSYFLRAFRSPVGRLSIAKQVKQVETVANKVIDTIGNKRRIDFASRLTAGEGVSEESQVNFNFLPHILYLI